MRSLVDKAFYQIRETGAIRLFKSHRPEYRDGEQQRDFIYVKDAVAMTLHLAQQHASGLFNIGSGTAHTWLDLIRPIFRGMNVPERIEFIDMPEQLRDKYQYCTCATIDRLRASGYDAPITPLAEAVDDYVRNYLIPDRRLDPAYAPAGVK
jgi:ADP-L-glycero-D-manno-heptose 6-epimerase